MWLEGLHYEVDASQEDKLENNTWTDTDTPLQDLANREIDKFQQLITELPTDEQEVALRKLQDFLNSLEGGQEFEQSDIEDLFEVLSPSDTIQNSSLHNWLPVLGDNYYGDSKWIISDILYNIDSLKGMELEDILKPLWNEIKYTQDSKWWDHVDNKRQTQLNTQTQQIYAKLLQSWVTREELESYMLFWPELLWDLKNEKVQDFYNDLSNKTRLLESHVWLEERLYIVKIWEFMNSQRETQIEMLSNDGTFAENLRRYWVTGHFDVSFSAEGIPRESLKWIELTQFSQDSEVIQAKTHLFDSIIEKCSNPEQQEEMLIIYWVYLEYAGDSSQSVEQYISKLSSFEDMLEDEFSWKRSVWNFIERLSSLILRVSKLNQMGKVLGELRRLKSYVQNNALEASLFAASFCPYAGDVLDMAYGSYKYKNWVNFSWDSVSSLDAWVQACFGCIGLGINILFPWWWTWIKAFLNSTAELWIIKNILDKVLQLMPQVIQILERYKDNMLLWLKELKDFFAQNILPIIKGELHQIMAMVK